MTVVLQLFCLLEHVHIVVGLKVTAVTQDVQQSQLSMCLVIGAVEALDEVGKNAKLLHEVLAGDLTQTLEDYPDAQHWQVSLAEANKLWFLRL